MSKESTQATPCPGCGRRMYYVEQHMPHCTFDKPLQRPRKKKEEARNGA